MPEQTDAPKVFISYSWSPAQHQQKVIAFAQRLQSNGVHVILDVWDLAPGQDKNVFMEQTVNNPDIKRVLLICNKSYTDKANGRQGGVGTESMIMSKEVYEKADQTKFIPLVFEANERGEAYMPTFVHSRIYFDLRDTDQYEAEYEKLIRNIFDKPEHRRPPLGMRPSYLDEEGPILLPTAGRVDAIKRAYLDGRPNAPMLVKDYYTTFIESLKAVEPQEDEVTADTYLDFTFGRIEQLKVFRDDFIHFWETYLSVVSTPDIETMHRFFERLVTYYDKKAIQGYHSGTIGTVRFDYLRFFVYELILHFTTLLLQEEQFSILAEFIYDTFIVPREQAEPRVVNFLIFSGRDETLTEFYNKKDKQNRVSIFADKVKERASEKHSFEQLKQSDILLYYLSYLLDFKPNQYSISTWKPDTSCYNIYSLPLFDKLISQRYFDKIKVLFAVNTKEELANKVHAAENDSNAHLWSRSSYWINRDAPQMSQALKLEKIGSVR